MTEFRRFPKIYRLGTPEVDGILTYPVTVQEKLDGANVSIWVKKDGSLGFGSRNQEVASFRGFPEYCHNHDGINAMMRQFPNVTLYGEWLVKHTVQYKPNALNHFYLFDVCGVNSWWNPGDVELVAEKYGIKTPKKFIDTNRVSIEKLQEFVGQSDLTLVPNSGEGIVIKTFWSNQWGAGPYAKMVSESFKEEYAAHFRAHDSEKFYFESLFTHKYVTPARVAKIMQKISNDTDLECLSNKDTGRVISTVYHDILTEEIMTIAKKTNKPFDFGRFQRMVSERTRDTFHQLLQGE